MYVTRPYWSQETINCYNKFMATCFKTYRGHGKDAGVIAMKNLYEDLPNWNVKYNDSFVDGYDNDKIIASNRNLLNAFSKDFGIT